VKYKVHLKVHKPTELAVVLPVVKI